MSRFDRSLESRTLEENLESALGHHLDPVSLNSLHSSILDSVKKSSPSIMRNKLKTKSTSSNHHQSSHHNSNSGPLGNSGTNNNNQSIRLNQSPYERNNSSPINCRDSTLPLFNERERELRDPNPLFNNSSSAPNSFNPGENSFFFLSSSFHFLFSSHILFITLFFLSLFLTFFLSHSLIFLLPFFEGKIPGRGNFCFVLMSCFRKS